jgi:hypothetical protein
MLATLQLYRPKRPISGEVGFHDLLMNFLHYYEHTESVLASSSCLTVCEFYRNVKVGDIVVRVDKDISTFFLFNGSTLQHLLKAPPAVGSEWRLHGTDKVFVVDNFVDVGRADQPTKVLYKYKNGNGQLDSMTIGRWLHLMEILDPVLLFE